MQLEVGFPVQTIEYTDDVRGTFLAFVQATAVKTLTVAEVSGAQPAFSKWRNLSSEKQLADNGMPSNRNQMN